MTCTHRYAAVVVALAVMVGAAAPRDAEARPAVRQLRTVRARPQRAGYLLRSYRRDRGLRGKGHRLRFGHVDGKTVYNPTRVFSIGDKRVLAGRVESLHSERDTRVVFFERRGSWWVPVSNAPKLALQDPFVAKIGGETIIGGVETQEHKGSLRYRTVFYRGDQLSQLKRFAAGPWGMKDIRLSELADGRILVLTRPQGERGGRGKIGWTVINSLAALTPRAIRKAPLIEGQFANGEWGGANEITKLADGRLGVLGHIARFDARGARKYYPAAFTIDPKRGEVSPLRLLLERRDLPNGLGGLSKRRDLKDVLFAGGLERDGRGNATLTVGAGDAEAYRIKIRDPFAR